jgi:DNA-binding response OmpR family regulator
MRERPVVLVVHDDPMLRALLADFFEVAGWSTFKARDGEHALQQIEEYEPDVVVLDLALRRMQGLEALRLLRPHGTVRSPQWYW